MNRIRLLSTDFDGTLIGHPSDGRCVPDLAACLSEFAAAGGLWALNTGRSLDHAMEGIAQFDAPVEPDFLLTNERDVYCKDGDRDWVPYGDWNTLCTARHARLFTAESGIFDRIEAALPDSPDVRIIEENHQPAGLITSSENVMASVVQALEPLQQEFPDFSWQRNTVYLRFCHREYHKGAALGELCRLIGLGPEAAFAAGDHFNDLSMLCGTYARTVACPENAIPEVKTAVRQVGGFVSSLKFGAGIADALRSLRIV